jgi:hypothetical protein
MRYRWIFLLLNALVLSQCAPSSPVYAPQREAAVADQLSLAGNACGPTAVLNALRHGSVAHQAAARAIPGDTDAKQLRDIVLHQGAKGSRHIPQRRRWSRRGINAADLADVTNELLKGHQAPSVRLWIPQSSDHAGRIYSRIARSLRAGFPPVVGLRRYAGYQVIDSHFITVLGISPHPDGDKTSFAFDYIDPMGGRKLRGIVRCENRSKGWRCVAELPQTPVGLKRAQGPSQLYVDSLILVP